MTKAIRLTESEWECIFEMIKKEHPPSSYLFRENMKDRLGFTTRSATSFPRNNGRYDSSWCDPEVHLDFFSDAARTMFLLKYGDFFKPKSTRSPLRLAILKNRTVPNSDS